MAVVWRGAALFGLWVVIGGGATPADLAMGVVAAALAARASLRLAPPVPGPALRLLALAALLLRLPWGVLRAGTEVAIRAFAPRMGLRPGLVAFAPALPPGRRRDAFLALSALLPGTVPAGTGANGTVAIHALDTTQPIAADMRREEARFAGALGGHG